MPCTATPTVSRLLKSDVMMSVSLSVTPPMSIDFTWCTPLTEPESTTPCPPLPITCPSMLWSKCLLLRTTIGEPASKNILHGRPSIMTVTMGKPSWRCTGTRTVFTLGVGLAFRSETLLDSKLASSTKLSAVKRIVASEVVLSGFVMM